MVRGVGGEHLFFGEVMKMEFHMTLLREDKHGGVGGKGRTPLTAEEGDKKPTFEDV